MNHQDTETIVDNLLCESQFIHASSPSQNKQQRPFLQHAQPQQQEQEQSSFQTHDIVDFNANNSNAFVEAETFQNSNPALEQFRGIVKKLVHIDNAIRDMNAELKILRSTRETLKQQVSAFMQNRDIEQLNLPDGGKITMNHTERKSNMYTKKNIDCHLVEYFKQVENLPTDKAIKKKQDICQYMDSIAPTIKSSNIRRLRK